MLVVSRIQRQSISQSGADLKLAVRFLGVEQLAAAAAS